MTTPIADDVVARIAKDLLTTGSLEMSAHRPGDARKIAELLPTGTAVYVNHLPRHALSDTLNTAVAVRDAGLEPVPHIAARRVEDKTELSSFLRAAVRSAGVKKALVLGGDLDTPLGPFADAASLLSDTVFSEEGIREVGFAGYPEGHPRISQQALMDALDEKLALADRQQLGAYIVTQFCFAPSRIVQYCDDLKRRLPNVPVYVGIPGPVSPARLIQFAHKCGVGASLRALETQGFSAVRLITHTDPSDQLFSVAHHLLSGKEANVVGTHIFSFGGAEKAAHWINSYIMT